jgi:hypothetical protein
VNFTVSVAFAGTLQLLPAIWIAPLVVPGVVGATHVGVQPYVVPLSDTAVTFQYWLPPVIPELPTLSVPGIVIVAPVIGTVPVLVIV